MADQKLSAVGTSALTDASLGYFVKSLISYNITFLAIYNWIKGKLDIDTLDGGSF